MRHLHSNPSMEGLLELELELENGGQRVLRGCCDVESVQFLKEIDEHLREGVRSARV